MSAETPMRCKDAAPYLSAFADGELTESLQARVAEHVASCAVCSRAIARYRGIDSLIQSLPSTAPSPAVFARVQDEIAARAGSQVRRESVRAPDDQAGVRRRLVALRRVVAAGDGPAPVSSHRRQGWISVAVPMMAAVLIVSLAVLTFARIHDAAQVGVQPTTSATPAPAVSVLVQTQQALAAARGQLGFTPVAPTYLPANAHLKDAKVSAASAPQNANYLDITWSIPDGPMCQVHLREAPKDAPGVGYIPAGNDASLSWQLPSHPAWRPAAPAGALALLAVGQDRGSFTIALDGTLCAGTSVSDDSIAVLRLISLSMDQPYQPKRVVPIMPAGRVMHVIEQVTDANGAVIWQREMYSTLDQGTQRIIATRDGVTLYTMDIAGQAAIQLNDAQQKYYSASASQLGGQIPLPDTGATQIFYGANPLVDRGELWYLGSGTVPTSQVQAWKFALVDGWAPTTIYVDPTSEQVLAVQIGSPRDGQPGGPAAAPKFIASDGCGQYTLIQYLVAQQSPLGALSLRPPTGYHPLASSIPLLTCPATNTWPSPPGRL